MLNLFGEITCTPGHAVRCANAACEDCHCDCDGKNHGKNVQKETTKSLPDVDILIGDALTQLKMMSDESVDCVVTSPPYWALRDYGVDGQLGLEATSEKYVEALVAIFDEVKRVLKKTGTCWVNIGDTYFGGGRNKNNHNPQVKSKQRADVKNLGDTVVGPKGQSKCLAQIPARFAIMMTDHGWILRNELIWWKPNAMPSSVSDRFTVDFEKLFFFTKEKKYHFTQQLEPSSDKSEMDYRRALRRGKEYASKKPYQGNFPKSFRDDGQRNKRSVWSIATKPFTGAHFAVFPEKLVEVPILAGCRAGGVVLDPFAGSGTTGIVAMKHGRSFIGIELNPEYAEMAKKRLEKLSTVL